MTAIAIPGSLKALMDGLVDLENEVIAAILEETGDQVHGYRWRPRGSEIELPALYNWLAPSAPMDEPSVAEVRDTVTIAARLAIPYSTPQDEMATLEQYADIFRALVDPKLHNATTTEGIRPLGGAATRAWRSGIFTVSEAFNDISALAIELPIVCQLRRVIR